MEIKAGRGPFERHSSCRMSAFSGNLWNLLMSRGFIQLGQRMSLDSLLIGKVHTMQLGRYCFTSENPELCQGKGILKTLWVKEKRLATNLFSIVHYVFYPLKD